LSAILNPGEWKMLVNEKVVHVPGPDNELETVRQIFREFADERRSLTSIAARLNSDGIPCTMGKKWNVNSKTGLPCSFPKSERQCIYFA